MGMAINLSPLAVKAMGDRSVMRAWAEASIALFDAKPAGVLTIISKKDADALVAFGLVKPVTYQGHPVLNRYRVPRSVAFISECDVDLEPFRLPE